MKQRYEQGFGVVASLVSFVFGVIATLVALRIILRLFGANAEHFLVSWVYATSQPLVQPFFGIFNTTASTVGGMFELESLLALVVYAVIGGLLVRLVGGSRSAV